MAHRAYGVTQWFTGNYGEARAHLEQAVAIFDPERDRDLAFRFGQDVGVSAMVYLAIALWPLGQVDRAREIADATAARIGNLSHLATSTYGLMHCAMFEIIGQKVDRAAPLARALSSVAHEHGIALWVAFGAFLEAWVELRSGVPDIGVTNLRRAAALLQRDSVGAFQPLVRTALAEAEARNGETAAALATLSHALEDFESSGQRWFDAEIHRMRGEILLEQNPADPGLAEVAYLAANRRRANIRRPAASNYARRLRSRNSTSSLAAQPTRTPSSRPPSKASRRPRKCPKLRRRRHC